MAFNAEQFLAHYRIESWPAGSKNVPAGCIGVRCPFCGDTKNHMHFRLNSFSVKCWRCGPHKITETISLLLNLPLHESYLIIEQYVTDGAPRQQYEPRTYAKRITYPAGIIQLDKLHKRYLESRNFDPYELERIWKLKATNHLDTHYKWRIVAPVTIDHQVVSYQCRAITNQQEPPYRACRPEHEVISHKDVLYGADIARGASVVVVEGVTDAWRLGAGAVCTFGVKWTPAQALRLVRGIWDRIYILFDRDEAGQAGGLSMYHFLRGFKDNIELLQLTDWADPGSMPDSDARYLMTKELKI